ncbi:hypothetical protein Pfo_009825 [Paulownia fortunei]|nr:hypothetical protein Pfo_009825 [Paulownia fortunei]
MSPVLVQGCDLHEGNWGSLESVICWNYTHGMLMKRSQITLKVIEGDVLDCFKTFIVGIHADTKGETNLVTWALEYEKIHKDVEDPISLILFCINLIKDIESHHLKT